MRVIDRDVPRERIRVSHPSYDQTAVRRDINALFPLDRLLEFERDGVIGRLAQRNVSYMGLTHHKKIEEHLVPVIVDGLIGQGVDAAIHTPGCPGCHLTISQVARGLEEAGVATVTVQLDIYRRWAVERPRLPRTLFSPFFLGRLLGAPCDAERQRVMVGHCLDLLVTAGRSGASHDPGYSWRAAPDVPLVEQPVGDS